MKGEEWLKRSLFIFAKMDTIEVIAKLNLKDWYAYLVPIVGSLAYFDFALIYYVYKLESSFEHMIA